MLTLFQKLLKENEEEEATISGNGVSPYEPTKKNKEVATNPETDEVKGTEIGDVEHPDHKEDPDIEKRLEDEKQQFLALIRRAQDMLNSPGPQDNWLDKFLTHFSNITAYKSVGDYDGYKREIEALESLNSLRLTTKKMIENIEGEIKANPSDDEKIKLKQSKVTNLAKLKETEEIMKNRFGQLADTRAYYERHKHNRGIFANMRVEKANLYKNEANKEAGVAATKDTKLVSQYDVIAPGSTAAGALCTGAATLFFKGTKLAAAVGTGLIFGNMRNRITIALSDETKIEKERRKGSEEIEKIKSGPKPPSS